MVRSWEMKGNLGLFSLLLRSACRDLLVSFSGVPTALVCKIVEEWFCRTSIPHPPGIFPSICGVLHASPLVCGLDPVIEASHTRTPAPWEGSVLQAWGPYYDYQIYIPMVWSDGFKTIQGRSGNWRS